MTNSRRVPAIQSGGRLTLSSYWVDRRENEFFEGIEYALGQYCSDIVGDVNRGQGYELMRQLLRTFDPKQMNVRQQFIAELHLLTNKKCQDFAAVVARVSYIDRIVKEMQEVCGEHPGDKTLSDVFAPSLDPVSNSQLATIRNERYASQY